MPKRRKRNRAKPSKPSYHKMTTKEIKAARKKLSITSSTPHITKKKVICDLPKCNKKATTVCRYCSRHFCDYHSKPLICTSLQEITNMDSKFQRQYPGKYKKYMEDWNRADGHPCTNYTEWWNDQYNKDSELLREKQRETLGWILGRVKKSYSSALESEYAQPQQSHVETTTTSGETITYTPSKKQNEEKEPNDWLLRGLKLLIIGMVLFAPGFLLTNYLTNSPILALITMFLIALEFIGGGIIVVAIIAIVISSIKYLLTY